MKKTHLSIIIGLLTLFFISCQDQELRTHFPASMPVFDKASVAENSIVYGDSITLSVGVSDPKTPLSTLEIKVVVNDEIVAKETVRTKGNSASYAHKYAIPFVAHRPNAAEVEVHLSSINVEGTKHDTILTNTIASRPAIPTIYLVTNTATVELKLTDAAKYIYSASGLTFSNNISFRLATKVNRFKKIDWAATDNIVFGWDNNGLGLVKSDTIDDVQVISGDMITLSDATLVGFNKITLDLYNFTIKGEGDKLTPATTMNVASFGSIEMSSTNHLNVSTKETWKTAQMYLGKGTVMTISGVGNVANGMAPDFFEVTGTNTVKFLGETAIYTVYYYPGKDYVFVERPTATYPDALWLCGVGFGPVHAPYAKTSSWNWNTPLEYLYCNKVSDGIYQATFYAEHVIDPTITEPWRLTFNAKFFHQRGWGDEEDARTYNISTPLLYAPTTSDTGNFVATADFAAVPGVYRFTLNVKSKTMSFVKIK